jgi:hypothetical protein
MTAMHTIRPDGLAGRIAAYFEENQGEELLYSDACAKFDCTPKRLYQALARLRSVGDVEVVHIIRATNGRPA